MQLNSGRGGFLLVLVGILAGTGWPVMQADNRQPTTDFVSQRTNGTSVVPTSRSLILRATHILLIQIVSSQPGPWIMDQAESQKRTVQLRVRLEEVLKGTVRQPGSEVRIKVDQTRRSETWDYPVPGVWSDAPIDPGTRLIAFSRSSSKRPEDLLVEPSCERLLPSDEYLLDVRLAMQTEAQRLPLSGSLELAEPSAASLNFVFAEYVTAKFDDSLLRDVDGFRSLMTFMEKPALSRVARTLLLTDTLSKLIASDPVPMPYVQAFTITLFHIVALPQASSLRDNILQVYLPNFLGLRSGRSAGRKAEDVFRGIPEERQKAERVLQEHRGEAAADALMRWLRE